VVAFEVVDATSAEARRAMQQYFDELAGRFGFAAGDAIERAGEEYNPPRGLFLLARDGDLVVGCGALVALDRARAEIKRMWVSPLTRGRGIGSRLLARLEEAAVEAGHSLVVLDTNADLVEAIAMYERAGYQQVEPYNDNPDAELWFEKAIRS
jgi:GNAT superfamily N-acetyltransferase